MLKGRLGLETARVPQADRHGVLWLGHGRLYVENGTLRFATTGKGDQLPPGDYAIPFQLLSCILGQPGISITHDALRLLARHDVGLVCCGEDGVRFYASLPAGPDSSARARRHVEIWSDPARRIEVVLRMYEMRMGERLKVTDLNALRGIEGARMKRTYQLVAQRFRVPWEGRRYDRAHPEATNVVNQAINHASSALQGAALVATAVAGAVPQLGFIHEDSGLAFALDVADLYRDDVLLPIAFAATREALDQPSQPIERLVRSKAGRVFRERRLVAEMIERIKTLLGEAEPAPASAPADTPDAPR